MCELLLKKGANINKRTVDGHTALMLSSQAGYKDLTDLLLVSGADYELLSLLNETALILASYSFIAISSLDK